MAEIGTTRVKRGLAEMFKGGVIMDVTTVDQAKIAEEAGAVSVMALERIPADIRREGGVARSADPDLSSRSWTPSRFPSWPRCESDTSPKHGYWSIWASTSLTRAKCCLPLMLPII